MADSNPRTPDDISSNNVRGLADRAKVQQWLLQNYFRYSFADAYPGHSDFSVQDFTGISDLDKWFNGDIMSLALALSTDSHNRQDDVLVISTNSTQSLYNLGLGRLTMDEIRTLPSLYQSLLDTSKRWIVIPCSDGTLLSDQLMEGFNAQIAKKNNGAASRKPNTTEPNAGTDATRPKKGTKVTKRTPKRMTKAQKVKEAARKKKEAEEEERKKKEEERKRKEYQIPAGHEGHGSHWGLLIVDKQQKVAHWVDSLVTLGPDGKISHMLQSAVVGGKVLCGIDAILATQEGHEKGKFNASTLKYVPHQMRDNDCADDMGACGPFAFAFLQHLYKNPAKMEHLKASFPRSRHHSLRFDSLHEREEVQRLVQRAADDDKKDAMPFGLTLDLLHILSFLTPGNVSEMARSFGSSSRPSRRGPAAGNKRSNDDDNDADDDSDGDWSPGGDDMPIPKDQLRQALGSMGSTVLEGLSKDERYRLAYSTLKAAQESLDKRGNDGEETSEAKKVRETGDAKEREAQMAREAKEREAKKDEEAKELEDKKAKEAKEFEAQKAQEAKEREAEEREAEKKKIEAAAADAERQKAEMLPPKPRHPPKIQFPEEFPELPKDFADMEEVPFSQLQKWLTANALLLRQMPLQKESEPVAIRAALQVLAGIAFEDETDARLTRFWIRDTNVFNPGEDVEYADNPFMIRDRMRHKYDIQDARDPVVETPLVTTPVGASPNATAPPEVTAPPVIDFTKGIDWATAPGQEVNAEMSRSEMLIHESVIRNGKVSGVTTRAILYVRNGGTFAGESNAFLDKEAREIWVRDLNVFIRGEDFEMQEKGHPPKLLNGLRADQIRARMKARYEAADVVEVLSDNDSPQAISSNEDDVQVISSNKVVVNISSGSDSSLSELSSNEDNDSSFNDDSNPPSGDGGNPLPDTGSNPQPDADDSTPSSTTINPPPANSNKRKRSPDDTQTSASAPATKQLKLAPPCFLTLDAAQLKIWLNRLKPHPIVSRFIKYEPTRTFTWQEYDYDWREDTPPSSPEHAPREDECRVEFECQVRLVLERVFNTTFQDMRKENPLSRESLATINRWYMMLARGVVFNDRSDEGLKRFLERVLMTERGAYGSLPDWSRGTEYWPEYWRRKFVVPNKEGEGK